MTAICGGGSSSAKPGFGASVAMGAGSIAALLNNIPTLWAVPLAGYIGLITYNLANFCTQDPPAVPNITALDVANLLNVYNPIPHAEAGAKFQQLVGAYAWYQLCQCDSVATPPPPAPPTPPNSSYPTPAPQLGQPCKVEVRHGFDLNITNPPYVVNDYMVPIGATSFRITTSWGGPFIGAVSNYRLAPSVDLGGASLQNYDFTAHQTIGTENWDFQLPFNARYARLTALSYGPRTTPGVHVEHDAAWYCNGTPPGIPYSPCGSDEQTLSLLEAILEYVRLIQRQAVPFAYVDSTVHDGLTGEGHFDVQGLIGCRVLLTTIPASVGVADGDPLEYFDAGWINWGNADGSTKREWIACSPMVSFPSLAGQYTRIGYTLNPGVTATITEIRREP